MLIADLPTAPWQKVGTDLFHLHGKDYLLVIDYYSNYPEVAQLFSTSAQSVITHMKGFFARHGIPQCVVSDNGPQYDCGEFSEFAKQYGFQQITSSPLYPQANGQAEKGVQIVKRLLKKASDSKPDPYLALLSYRAASLECGASPAELLMHRKLRTTLPHIPKDNDDKNNNKLTDKRMRLKHRQKMNYDKTVRCLEPLQEKDVVRIEGLDFWARKATVLSEVGPRSFVIKTENGQVLRRNWRSLLKTEDTENHTEETESEQQDEAVQDVQHSELPSPSPMTETLRRSTRPRKPPERLIEQG
uniref:Integrase catalytic domain-containing protein n=1 Tax=Seriola dumerili TaxID=41447 RepID=A0A3B4UX38_SERDU